ncbi:33635_t:CDS:2, partial [Racocetra persica]
VAQAEEKQETDRFNREFTNKELTLLFCVEETEFQKEGLNSQKVYTIGQLELEEEYLLTSEDYVET